MSAQHKGLIQHCWGKMVLVQRCLILGHSLFQALSQEEPGGAKRSQEKPGEARRSQESPGTQEET